MFGQVSLFCGRCPWLSARSAVRVPASTDIWRTASARRMSFCIICAGQRLCDGCGVAVCKTVGSAYVGSNPTLATRLRRSEPVTLECVTGFSAERERLHGPSAVSRGLCVGRIRASPGFRGYRLRCRLSCENTSGGGCLRAVQWAGRARWPWAVRGTGDRLRVQIADRVWGGADGVYNRSLSRVVTDA